MKASAVSSQHHCVRGHLLYSSSLFIWSSLYNIKKTIVRGFRWTSENKHGIRPLLPPLDGPCGSSSGSQAHEASALTCRTISRTPISPFVFWNLGCSVLNFIYELENIFVQVDKQIETRQQAWDLKSPTMCVYLISFTWFLVLETFLHVLTACLHEVWSVALPWISVLADAEVSGLIYFSCVGDHSHTDSTLIWEKRFHVFCPALW